MNIEDIWGIPYRLTAIDITFNKTNDVCNDDIEKTNGQILFSYSLMTNQISCRPNVLNLGNWYGWSAATAKGKIDKGDELNSICPSSWLLPPMESINGKNFDHLVRTIYGITETNSDGKIINQPLSFVRAGFRGRYAEHYWGNEGHYWTSTTTGSQNISAMNFSKSSLSTKSTNNSYYNYSFGYSLRCDGRSVLFAASTRLINKSKLSFISFVSLRRKNML